MRQAWLILILDLVGPQDARVRRTLIASQPAERYALDPQCPSTRAYVNITAANGSTQREARARLSAKMKLPAFSWAENFLDLEEVTQQDLPLPYLPAGGPFDSSDVDRRPARARRYPSNVSASSTAHMSDDPEAGEVVRSENTNQQRANELDEPSPA